ncbi:C-C motif chemokine 4-like [Poecile atricapillus]|uniref:C-C motif chemokine 4-like n=1 Tax=Poecile atricapillus TaxID=48891 RepID=UPI0027390C0A|nr:C-C motif chemokine 4-like [Poecile atricapillus]
MGIKGEHGPRGRRESPAASPDSSSDRALSTMKVLAATLVTLLLLATCSPSEGHLDGVPSACCFSYQRQPIPRRRVSSVFITSSSCTQRGVIVVTKKNKQVCADPRAPWVQELLKHFQSLEN